ncbi:hypothetical protein OG896_24520 [Streptomyces sp. NBC_00669]|uniref:hypothetical protein n=1 Tax=Streptomyces sp. NBC_00669 TaxID=2976011 RepID=UPI002E340B01|nr:hypothetical protein [Streptomyces sp. NBC_00669]
MSCCDERSCDCIVTAGPGVTVDGNGSSTDPYVIGADGGGGAPAALTVTDSPTVDLTLTGAGTATDPYDVTAAVIVDPAPPGGGDNLVHAGDDGLYVECADIRSCISAGDGAAYDPDSGEVDARLSTDAGNLVQFGTDGGLLVPPPAVACGLTGTGTAADPITANPVAGQAAWADTWACDAATHSTLHCDPSDGALWTPPEHYSAADSIYVEHFEGGWADPVTVTDWRVFTDTGGTTALVQFTVPANFLGNDCRVWEYLSVCAGTFDISWTADATFEVGYGLSKDGGTAQIRPVWGILTPTGAARRERHAGTAQAAGFNLAPDAAESVIFYAVARVMTGSITINSWESDATIHTTTSTL